MQDARGRKPPTMARNDRNPQWVGSRQLVSNLPTLALNRLSPGRGGIRRDRRGVRDVLGLIAGRVAARSLISALTLLVTHFRVRRRAT